jgi:hypothetical protein
MQNINFAFSNLIFLIFNLLYSAFVTLPERKHRVHTYARCTLPSDLMRIFFMFGIQRRLVRL